MTDVALGASISLGYLADARAEVENLLARASVLDLAQDVVRELIEAEQRRCEVTPDPFNWERVKNQIDHAAGVFG